MGRLAVAAAAVVALVASTPSESRSGSNPLVGVRLASGRLHAAYRLPAGFVPYSIGFAAPGRGTLGFVLAPGGGAGKATARAWTSTAAAAKALGRGTFTVRLSYGRKTPCLANAAGSLDALVSCGHRVSAPLTIRIAAPVPALRLLGSNRAAGTYVAGTQVSGRITHPASFSIRVVTEPAGLPVNIAWDVGCYTSRTTSGDHGRFRRTAPFTDSTQLRIVGPRPDYCIYGVYASLDRGGTVVLRVYGRAR